jgi:hypothetical protein
MIATGASDTAAYPSAMKAADRSSATGITSMAFSLAAATNSGAFRDPGDATITLTPYFFSIDISSRHIHLSVFSAIFFFGFGSAKLLNFDDIRRITCRSALEQMLMMTSHTYLRSDTTTKFTVIVL